MLTPVRAPAERASTAFASVEGGSSMPPVTPSPPRETSRTPDASPCSEAVGASPCSLVACLRSRLCAIGGAIAVSATAAAFGTVYRSPENVYESRGGLPVGRPCRFAARRAWTRCLLASCAASARAASAAASSAASLADPVSGTSILATASAAGADMMDADSSWLGSAPKLMYAPRVEPATEANPPVMTTKSCDRLRPGSSGVRSSGASVMDRKMLATVTMPSTSETARKLARAAPPYLKTTCRAPR
mmetsp:Transcript_35604/g.114451  ORF Transcript_35604/g.114451 Transcript_35604/m.114451 type:complete len:247 (-) Transcript_35604:807-1547(-)